MGLLNQNLDSQKIYQQQKEMKKDVIKACWKAKASKAMTEHLRKVLVESKSNLAKERSNLAETKTNMVVVRANLELER